MYWSLLIKNQIIIFFCSLLKSINNHFPVQYWYINLFLYFYQTETEEGFCLIFSKKVNIDEVEEESSNNETAESPETAEEEGLAITNIRHLMKVL